MLKYFVGALIGIGLGIFIGVAYTDQIEDVADSRLMVVVQDVFDDAKEQFSDSELGKKLEAMNN